MEHAADELTDDGARQSVEISPRCAARGALAHGVSL
jgi:hypothetical protein